jgi:hypothetical protein
MRYMMAALALWVSTPAASEVTDVERGGFTIALTADVPVMPDVIFPVLSRPADWWDAEHSWTGDLRNMSFEPRVGGCWCETLRSNGTIEHGRIVTYDPVRGLIVMNSLLGPLNEIGLVGRLVWRVAAAEQEGRSRIRWLYAVSVPPSRNPAQDAVLASAVDNVLSQQLARLAAHVSRAPMPTPTP